MIVRPDIASTKLIKLIMRANAMIERSIYEYPKQKMQEMDRFNREISKKRNGWKM